MTRQPETTLAGEALLREARAHAESRLARAVGLELPEPVAPAIRGPRRERRRRRLRIGVLTAVALGVVAGGAGVASGATVMMAGSALLYTAGNAVNNDFEISYAGSTYTINDTGETISLVSAPNCSAVDVNTVTCSDGSNQVTSVTISLLDGDDAAQLLSTGDATTVDGGANTVADTVTTSGDVNATLTNTQLVVAPGGTFTLAGFEWGSLTGGTGANTFTINAFSGDVSVNGAGGTDTVAVSDDKSFGLISSFQIERSGGGTSTIALSSVEGVSLTDTGAAGSNHTHVVSEAWTTATTLTAGAGTDVLAPTSDAAAQTLTTTSFTRTGASAISHSGVETASLTGGNAATDINASAFGGPVTVRAGGGNDTVWSGAASDDLDGEGGIDQLNASADADLTLTTTSLTGVGTDAIAGFETALLTGGAGANTLNALGANGMVATLDGGNGNDTLIGSTGADSLVGNGGTDRVDAAANSDFTLTNTALNNATLGNDALNGVEQAFLTGGASGNALNAAAFTNGSVTLVGGGGNDALTGGTAADVLTGNDGNDTLTGGNGTDRVSESADTSFTLTNTALTSGATGTDQLAGIEQASLVGGNGANALDAGAFTAGGTTLDGGAGNDTLTGGTQGDVLLPGAGDDVVTGGNGTDRVQDGGVGFALSDSALTGNGTDALAGIEQASLDGSAGNDGFTVSGWTRSATLAGGAGNDSYTIGFAGSGTVVVNDSAGTDAATLLGSAGVDPLVSTATQVSRGPAETVSLTGVEGRLIDAGAGNDGVTVNGGSGTVRGSEGDDAIDVAAVGPGGLAVDGGNGSDTTTVTFGTLGAGPITVSDSGVSGTDALVVACDVGAVITATTVKLGNETITFSGIETRPCSPAAAPNPPAPPPPPGPGPTTPKCTITGNAKNNTLRGTKKRDVICGLGGNDTILGLGGNDVLIGGPGNDSLVGGAGKDSLRGDAGNDRLDGGAGKDTLLGGTGKDLLLAKDGLVDSLDGNSGRDRGRYDAKDKVKGVETRLK
ncbi:MAG: calcium-binding protein [Thermoleophilia bacterium]